MDWTQADLEDLDVQALLIEDLVEILEERFVLAVSAPLTLRGRARLYTRVAAAVRLLPALRDEPR